MKVKLPKWNRASQRRKAEVRIDHWDTWNFDHTFATIALPALLQLKNTKQGVPAEFGDVGGASYDAQSSFEFYEETHNDAFDESCKRWETILDKMIWSFTQILDGSWEEKYHHGEQPDYYSVESEYNYTDPKTGKVEKTYTMLDRNKGKHYTDVAGLEEHQKRIDEGLELFGKYYRHLWD